MIYEEFGETPGTKRAIAQAGTPDLTGTPEEVAQAQEIRSRLLVEGDDIMGQLRADQIMTEAQRDTAVTSPRQVTIDQVHSAETALNRLRNVTDASWWIAQANTTAEALLTSLMNEAVQAHNGGPTSPAVP